MPLTTTTPFIIHPPADLLKQSPHLSSLAKQLSLLYAHKQVVTEDALQAVGQALWQGLQIDKAYAQAKQRAGKEVLPVVIETADPSLFMLPWECLWHPTDGFLGKQPSYALSRRWLVPATVANESVLGKLFSKFKKPQLPPLPKGPLQVLLFTTQPDDIAHSDQSRLDMESEQVRGLEALDEFIQQGRVQLTTPDDGRLATLRDLLQTQPFHLVFLSGHGNFNADQFSDTHNQAFFLFEGDDGKSQRVASQDLAQVFVGTAVQCVVLSACESGKTASDNLTAGLITSLANIGIPHVVGMRESVADEAGILFAHGFCYALARQERLDVAIQRGRREIMEAQTKPDRSSRPVRFEAELDVSQWPLPMLLSHAPHQPVIDWNFTPPPRSAKPFLIDSLATHVALPTDFIGRRKELREVGQALSQGQVRYLLLTGPGGQGKTALAGKLARKLQAQGYVVFAYSARPEAASWENFIFVLQSSLAEKQLVEQVDRLWGQCGNEMQRAQLLLGALLQQHQQRLALFFDNLESVQDPHSYELTDKRLATWITVAQQLAKPLVLLTSRWELPRWNAIPYSHHLGLVHANYGDFLRYLQQLDSYSHSTQVRLSDYKWALYEALHGNFKGLQLFHGLEQETGYEEGAALVEKLRQTQAELQLYMAIAQIVSYLQPEEKLLLQGIQVYTAPVLEVSLSLLAKEMGLANDKAVLHRLLALSLVEMAKAEDVTEWEYQLSPLVAEWLQVQHTEHPTEFQALGFSLDQPTVELRQVAARHLEWVFDKVRSTVTQALMVHEAYQVAELPEEAHRFALQTLVPYFNRRGMYRTLLEKWLPALREASDKKMRGNALNSSGTTCHALGDYDTALSYLQQSLVIQREIGDRAGEGTTLNNLSQIYDARGDYDTALSYLQQSLVIRREIGDREGEGTTLNNLSQIYDARGDYDTALSYLQQSLVILREVGDREGEGATLNNLSTLCYARGDYDTALSYLQQSLVIYREIGHRAGEGATLNNLSQIYDARGDYDTALSYLQQSLVIYREIGDRQGEGATLNNLSQIYHARGDYDTALSYLQQSLVILQEIGDLAGLCATLINMGHISWQKEDKQQAVAYWVNAYQIAKQIGHAQAISALDKLAKQLEIDIVEISGEWAGKMGEREQVAFSCSNWKKHGTPPIQCLESRTRVGLTQSNLLKQDSRNHFCNSMILRSYVIYHFLNIEGLGKLSCVSPVKLLRVQKVI
jgi:tetratricopeptide (TPR) repeat protein